MNKKQSITLAFSTIFLISVIGIALVPSALADGKSFYGTLYIDGSIAPAGIQITLKINNEIVSQITTKVWDDENYVFGINGSFEGSVASFFVEGYDIDQSVYISSTTGYPIDLYATTPPDSGEDPVDDGGGGSGGGGGSPPPTGGGGTTETNEDPIADAGGPYEGTTDTEIIFDGTNSSDPDGDSLTYAWDFGDGDTGDGAIVSHKYDTTGTFTVTLTVTDPSDATDDDETTATINVGNKGPTGLQFTGNETGKKGETLSYSAVATDPDDDTIKYIIDWGDGTSTEESALIGSGTSYDTTHVFDTFGIYTVTVYAEDSNGAKTGTVTLNVSIDAIPISGEISGYLGDKEGDGIYDVFIGNSVTTNVETDKNGNINIDSDDDSDWDYVYDPVNKTLTKYAESGEFDILPILGLIGLVLLAFLLFFFIYRRRGEKEDEQVPKTH